jgi:hypothetical protein
MKIILPGTETEIDIRRQPAQLMEIMRGKVHERLEHIKPIPPKQRVEVAPGRFEEIEDAQDESYLRQLRIYDEKTGLEFIEEVWKNIAAIGVTDEVTPDMVAAHREYYATMGVELPANDREVWLRYIVAATVDDFSTLMYEVYGKSLPSEKQVAFHRQLFPGKVQEQVG